MESGGRNLETLAALRRKSGVAGSGRFVGTLRRNLQANHYGMHFGLLSLTDASLNLTQDSTFLSDLHKSHVFRVVQSYRPRMLPAGHGGDGLVMIPFVSTSEWPTPVHAIFRAGTRSTASKYS
jgi:hypothetical protein